MRAPLAMLADSNELREAPGELAGRSVDAQRVPGDAALVVTTPAAADAGALAAARVVEAASGGWRRPPL